MKDPELRKRAEDEAKRFINEDSEYRMEYIEAEKPHPHTKNMSQTFASSVKDGIRLLFEVDSEMSERAEKTLAGEEFASFADRIRSVIKNGGRVIFSGCGSSGRLAMQLERSWRRAMTLIKDKLPGFSGDIGRLPGQVECIMTGGDYAVIRAAEAFEDSTSLGREQAKELHLCKNDLLVGVTATGETTSVIGTAERALKDGASVYMLISSPIGEVLGRMSRIRDVYSHENCSCLSLPCGPMALTGSTRMQSSTFEQLAGAVALEGAVYDVLSSFGKEKAFPGYAYYGKRFKELVSGLCSDRAVEAVSNTALKEQNTYENKGYVTLFADEYLLDALTDTTERAPTFMTPPFCSKDMKTEEKSWAFVKHPYLGAKEAWEKCFLRGLRCICWKREKYEGFGMTPEQIDGIPDLSAEALGRFDIGCGRMPEREESPRSLAEWIDVFPAPDSFYSASAGYSERTELTLEKCGVRICETYMRIDEHLALKIMLNALSTGVMARMGRIYGNRMICLAMSNKKLTDRSARIVSDISGLPYGEALAEVTYSKLLQKEKINTDPPVVQTLKRLGIM